METDNLFNDAKNGGSYQSWELATIGDPECHIQNFYSYGLQTCIICAWITGPMPAEFLLGQRNA